MSAESKRGKKAESRQRESQKLIAKKNFVLCQNEYIRVIKEGDDLADVPERFHPNLVTEGVL
jgi:hypothetical protein